MLCKHHQTDTSCEVHAQPGKSKVKVTDMSSQGKRDRELRTGNHLSRPHRSPADVAVNPTATRTAEFLQTDIALCPRESLLLKLVPFQFTIFTFLFVANELFCLLQPSLVPEECLLIENYDTHSKEMHQYRPRPALHPYLPEGWNYCLVSI